MTHPETAELDIYRALANEYLQLKDSANFDKTIFDGFKKFTTDDYFLLNFINQSIRKGNAQAAIDYLDAAVAKDPDNASLYDVLGQVYENDKKIEEAYQTDRDRDLCRYGLAREEKLVFVQDDDDTTLALA